MLKFVIGVITGVVIAYLAYHARALHKPGAGAAGMLGSVVLGLGGAAWALVLLTFFVPSSLLSRLFKGRKAVVDGEYA